MTIIKTLTAGDLFWQQALSLSFLHFSVRMIFWDRQSGFAASVFIRDAPSPSKGGSLDRDLVQETSPDSQRKSASADIEFDTTTLDIPTASEGVT